jgi:hypothetical protein
MSSIDEPSAPRANAAPRGPLKLVSAGLPPVATDLGPTREANEFPPRAHHGAEASCSTRLPYQTPMQRPQRTAGRQAEGRENAPI